MLILAFDSFIFIISLFFAIFATSICADFRFISLLMILSFSSGAIYAFHFRLRRHCFITLLCHAATVSLSPLRRFDA